MKQNRKLPGLLGRALANDPHGDTVALQMNPQEAQIVGGLLHRMGGADVQNPRTGMLQFYPAGSMGGGSNPGGDRNGYGGRSGDGSGTGNGGGGNNNNAGNPMSADQLQGWKAGTTDVPNNPTQIGKGKYDPDNIGRNETYGYYGSAPTATQNMLSRLGNFFGIGYHPNAINVGMPGFNEVQSRVSVDPLGMALSAAGMFNPMAQVASLGYKGLSMAGYGAPQVGFNTGGTLAGPSSPQSTPSGVPGNGSNSDPQLAANVTNQQQQSALQAAQGPTSLPSASPSLGLLGQAQQASYAPVWGDYGATMPGYGYLAWR